MVHATRSFQKCAVRQFGCSFLISVTLGKRDCGHEENDGPNHSGRVVLECLG
jgi:hypothetical protein